MLARQAGGHRLEEQQTEIAANAVSRAHSNVKRGARVATVETVAKKVKAILDKTAELADSNENDR
jgi:hypothetical protein